MKSPLIKRLSAYLIDMFIVSFICSIICYNILPKPEKYQNQLETLSNDYSNEKLTDDTYIKELETLVYDYQKENKTYEIVLTVMSIGYFVVFQYLNKGKTIGKKMFHLQVVNKTGTKEITIFKMFIREIFITNIFSNIVNIILLYTVNASNYFKYYEQATSIEFTFILVSVLLLSMKKYRKGLHDIITNTDVIEERR